MRELLVQEYKFNGDKHYSYPALLLSQTSTGLILYGPYGRPLTHPRRNLQNVPIPNYSVEFFFFNRPYNIAAAWDEAGAFRHYYCNVATPARLEGDVVHCTDLDLDLSINRDLIYTVEDEDEFEEHRIAWNYPPEVVAMCRDGLGELIRLFESRSYPFDGTAERLIREQPGFPRQGTAR